VNDLLRFLGGSEVSADVIEDFVTVDVAVVIRYWYGLRWYRVFVGRKIARRILALRRSGGLVVAGERDR